MGEFQGKQDEVARALHSLRHSEGRNDWAFATVDAEIRRLRRASEVAVPEILRLAKLRIDGMTAYDESEWCDRRHPGARGIVRLKLECPACIELILDGKMEMPG